MPKQSSAATPLKILVVDDEPFVCDSVKMLLEVDGYEVTTAGNGEEGLAKFKEGKFDVVFTDLMMPGIRGDELAVKMKELAPEQPIVMITAHAELLRPPVKGVDHILSKPFLLEDLRSAIAKTVKVKNAGSKR